MLITLFLKILVYCIAGIFFWLPDVSMPQGVINAFGSMVGYYNSFLAIFPPAQLPTTIFLTIILPFETAMLVAKFFLGARLPASHVN